MVKNPLANAGDVGLILGSGRSHGEGNGNPLQCSCLEDSMDRGAWKAIVYGVAKHITYISSFNDPLPHPCQNDKDPVTFSKA